MKIVIAVDLLICNNYNSDSDLNLNKTYGGNMLKTLTKIIAVTATTFAFLALSTVTKAADPIRIPVLNWSSQIVMANVLGQVFEEQGYTVELVPAESASRYEAVRIGDLHIAHETWESTMAVPFYEAMDKGGLIDAGTHDLITFEEMGFPDWILDDRPMSWLTKLGSFKISRLCSEFCNC